MIALTRQEDEDAKKAIVARFFKGFTWSMQLHDIKTLTKSLSQQHLIKG